MIGIALAVVGFTALGHECHRRTAWAPRAARAALTVMVYALVPLIAYANLAHLRLSAGVGGGLLLAYLCLGTVAACAWLVGTRVLGLPRAGVGALICVCMLANTGYLGLPVVSALLGSSQLPRGVAYDQLVSTPLFLTGGFAIGAAFGERAGSGARERLRTFLTRNPPLLAVIAGLSVPPSAAPHDLVLVTHHLVPVLLALGFFALGVNLAAERASGAAASWRRPPAPVGAAVLLRMGLTPLLLLALSGLVLSIPRAYLLQAAMPSGINALLVGHVFGLDLRLISAAIGWSTALALVAGILLSQL